MSLIGDESENLIDRTESPNICQSAFDECDRLHCPYGVIRRYDENQCERCHCEDPCQGYECPADSNCAIDIQPDVSEGTVFVPVCRQGKIIIDIFSHFSHFFSHCSHYFSK